MGINIKLKAGRNGEVVSYAEQAGISIEDIIAKYLDGTKKYYIATVNNRYRELGFLIEEDADIILHDMSKLIAMQTYQHSLIMIYLKAVKDVKGDLSVTIENSLNHGLFSAVKGGEAVSEEDVLAIENRMREIIAEDIPFVRGFVNKEDAIAFCKRRGLDEKVALLSDSDVEDEVEYYSLGDYRNFFFGYMVPSTSYIDVFELRRYKQGMLLRFPNEMNPDALPEYRDDVKLYEAFAETKKWRKIMDVEYLADLNQIVESGKASELIVKNEELQDKRFAEVAKQIVDSGKRIVLMAGPSSSGKTTSAKRLCAHIAELASEPLYLGTDDYFLEREDTPLGPDGQPNFEDLCAIDIELFNQNMNDLLAGKAVDIPEFDFIDGKKIFGNRITSAGEDQIIVIEGIHSLNEEMTSEIPEDVKFKVYISPLTRLSIDRHNRLSTSDARMLRRMVRDKQFRNYSASKTLSDWHKVRAGEEKNIFPYSNYADVVINSSMTYETALLKKYAEPLLKEISSDDPQYAEALRMLHFIKYFDIIEDDSAVPDNSILREFIGKRK